MAEPMLTENSTRDEELESITSGASLNLYLSESEDSKSVVSRHSRRQSNSPTKFHGFATPARNQTSESNRLKALELTMKALENSPEALETTTIESSPEALETTIKAGKESPEALEPTTKVVEESPDTLETTIKAVKESPKALKPNLKALEDGIETLETTSVTVAEGVVPKSESVGRSSTRERKIPRKLEGKKVFF